MPVVFGLNLGCFIVVFYSVRFVRLFHPFNHIGEHLTGDDLILFTGVLHLHNHRFAEFYGAIPNTKKKGSDGPIP